MNAELTPIDWAKRPIQKYADFSGRASRAEYWWYALGVVVCLIVLMIAESMLGLQRLVMGVYGPLTLLFSAAIFVPNITAGIRRLHDTGRPGSYVLLWLVPWAISVVVRLLGAGVLINGLVGLVTLVSCIVLLVFLVQPGTPGNNRYGPNPYGGAEPVAAE
jgi:uncharacterized membrane protein YhaH (DUF805 family)